MLTYGDHLPLQEAHRKQRYIAIVLIYEITLILGPQRMLGMAPLWRYRGARQGYQPSGES